MTPDPFIVSRFATTNFHRAGVPFLHGVGRQSRRPQLAHQIIGQHRAEAVTHQDDPIVFAAVELVKQCESALANGLPGRYRRASSNSCLRNAVGMGPAIFEAAAAAGVDETASWWWKTGRRLPRYARTKAAQFLGDRPP